MTDTRADFEAHFQLSSRQAKRDNAGEYIDEFVRNKWEGWQAAMAVAERYKAHRHRLLEFIEQAPVASGVCCCGDAMEKHRFAEHAPVDMWDHSVTCLVREILQSDAEKQK